MLVVQYLLGHAKSLSGDNETPLEDIEPPSGDNEPPSGENDNNT